MAKILVPLAYAVLLPIGLVIWWRKKSGEKLWPFIVGALCFTVFAMVLEQILHGVFLNPQNEICNKLTGNPLLYALYAAFAAGIFEETGRLFGFRVLLNKHKEKECSIAYGIGHGGFEVILVLALNYILLFLAYLGVSIGDPSADATLVQSAAQLTWPNVILGMLERIFALTAHVALSVLVFAAVKKKGKIGLYFLAVLLHAVLDFPAGLYQAGAIKSVLLIEVLALISAIVFALIALAVYRKYENPAQETEQTETELA